MKNLLIKFCIGGWLLVAASCNHNTKDTKNSHADSANTTIQSDNTEQEPSPATVTNKTDYSYEPSSVITGELTRELFYGAPGFGENPETDEKENEYLLLLDKPINVVGPAEPQDDSEESKYNITEIQLVYDKDSIDMGRYLGSKVILTGTFFGAHTGHHHTDVLMDVAQVSFK